MSIPKMPKPVKLVASLIYADARVCHQAQDAMMEQWGEIDVEQSGMSFDHTDYYRDEMGSPLWRSFISFQALIQRSWIVDVKLATNKIENRLAKPGGARTINIDPGYVTDSQFVLATGKNFSHRIYLDRGIFADLTLFFKDNRYQSLPWTYRDYTENQMMTLLMMVRKQYLKDSLKKYETCDKN